jgi:hypothetical protein
MRFSAPQSKQHQSEGTRSGNEPGILEGDAVKLEDDPMFKTLFAAAALTALMLGAALTLVSADAYAETKTVAMKGDALRTAVSGKTLYLNISGFELPIRYSASGSMSGSMGAVAATFARGDGASDRGKWWIAEDQICQRWTSWLDGKSYCYKFSVNGNAVRWVRNDGASGTARIG